MVEELLGSGVGVRQVLYAPAAREDPASSALVERCREEGVPTEEVGGDELAEFADTVTPRGVLAVGQIPGRGWSDLGEGDLMVFDAVQDPGNLGTLLRTAEALGVVGALSLPGTVDTWNPKVVRASAGSVFRVPVLSVDWPEARSRLGEREVPVWAADPEGEPVGRELAVPPRVALVLGNEGSGVSQAVLADASRRVAVSVRGRVESLNVAVAGALLMDRIFSARRHDPAPEAGEGGRR